MRFTRLDLPQPVAPSIPIVSPGLITRLKFSITFSLSIPGYANDTFLNSTFPLTAVSLLYVPLFIAGSQLIISITRFFEAIPLEAV